MRNTFLLVTILATVFAAGCGDENKSSGGGDTSNNAGNNDNNTSEPEAANNQPDGGMGGDTSSPEPEAPSFPIGGPNDLVDHQALMDPNTLDIEIDTQSTGTIQSGQSEAYLVSFSFTSQTYAGNTWRHQADLYMPLDGGGDVMGILQRGTENPVSRLSDTANFTNLWGIAPSVEMGAPILILSDVPAPMDLNTAELSPYLNDLEPRCRSGNLTQPDIIARCMFQIVHASGDASLDPLLHTAIVYIRAITAAQALPGLLAGLSGDLGGDDPPDFEINKAAPFFSSFRGAALPIAAAIDNRIQGFYQGSAAFGALEQFFALQQEVWPDGFLQGDPTEWVRFLDTAPGRDYMDKLDPAKWPTELLQDKVIVRSWGTQMTWAPLRAFNLYSDNLPTDTTHQFPIIDYADGLGSSSHLSMWKTFLVMSTGQRAVPKITTSFRTEGGNISVSASVDASDDGTLDGVTILFVSRHRDRDDLDFRDAVWQGVETMEKDGGFVGTFTPTSRNTAYVVSARDVSAVTPVTRSFVTSEVVVIEP